MRLFLLFKMNCVESITYNGFSAIILSVLHIDELYQITAENLRCFFKGDYFTKVASNFLIFYKKRMECLGALT